MPKGIFGNPTERSRKIRIAKLGENNAMYGKHHSEKVRVRISETMKRKGLKPPSNLGKHFSEEHRRKIGEGNEGKIISEEGRRNISLAHIGKKLSKETKKKIGRKGKEHYNWQGGITPLNFAIRNLPEYKQWRSDVFQRDNYTCIKCGQVGGDLQAHHNKKEFTEILTEFLQEYNQFSPYDDKDILVRLAMNYKPFWDVNNGETQCKDCHKLTFRGRLPKCNI